MSLIRVKTKTLIELLTDLCHTAHADPTAEPAMAGVLLHTDRGYPDPSEPGESDILVGTSTTYVHTGHTWMQCFGQASPMLWSITDVRSVISVFKPLSKKEKEHSLDIRHEGGEVTVAEDPTLFGETSLSFHTAALDDWPRDRFVVLDRNYEGSADTPSTARTDLDHATLAPLLKVAKRRGEPIQLYRRHQSKPILVQIGGGYRGVVATSRAWIEQDSRGGEMPGSDLYVPELPEPEPAGE